MFGQDNPSGKVDSYSQHLERGGVVLVVDAQDDAHARLASDLMRDAQAGDLHSVHRAGQRPLRDIVAERQSAGLERSFGTARDEMPSGSRGRQDSMEQDRAMAAARAGERPGIDEVDGDKPGGLRLKNMGRSDGI